LGADAWPVLARRMTQTIEVSQMIA
jgi:hypothetical protein